MLFHTFATYLEKLEGISSRLEMTYELAKLFNELQPEEVSKACYLLQGQLLPSFESLEFQIAVKTVIKALARCGTATASEGEATLFGMTDWSAVEDSVTKQYKQLGDLGSVAAGILHGNTSKGLELVTVYDRLWQLAKDKGEGSQQRKLDGLVALLKELDSISAKFVIRIVLAKLRLGFSTMTMLDALSWAMTSSKSETTLLEDAYQKRADIGFLAQTYLAETDTTSRQKALESIQVEVGVPIVPALCQRLNSSQEIIEKMMHVIAEPKYDGLRAQIHIHKTKSISAAEEVHVKTFTRNLEDNSAMFPELLTVLETLNCESCILDAEAIGYNPETGQLLPFQMTITRKRKHDIEQTATDVPLKFFVFDVLSLDGKSLIQEKLRSRKELLNNLFDDNEVFLKAPYIETSDPEELRAFHEAQLAEGLEGAVIKQVDSVYQSGRKGWSWVKIKEEEGTRGKLKDTLDCVVMGYYAGRGKRTAFGIGAFLVGVLAEDESLKTIAKIGTGLSDEQFAELKQRCQPLVTPDMPEIYEVEKSLIPDVWVNPGVVVEIAADEITKSPVHSAKVALRFPRLVKFRDDKNWQQATTTSELQSIQSSAS